MFLKNPKKCKNKIGWVGVGGLGVGGINFVNFGSLDKWMFPHQLFMAAPSIVRDRLSRRGLLLAPVRPGGSRTKALLSRTP